MELRRQELIAGAILLLVYIEIVSSSLNHDDRIKLRDKVVEMFDHAYSSYMNHAYPADELMPLSCKGRVRGVTPGRGDIDDALGNFSLTLIDTLDTLAIMGKVKEFESAIKLVLESVQLDSDLIVSVFETNIRVLGGLLGAHVMALDLKKRRLCCSWYEGGLLEKAKDVGYRLLPAFNTSTGIPYPRVNLKYGVQDLKVKDTCTACAGSMVLEFAALSRLTGIGVFEEKAHRAMDYLWQQRNRHSDLMGTVINIHNGDWVRRESGIGAGIDSYYEYLLKAYILLGEETYLQRFNKHYDGIMRYISQGPLMMNVEMHRPTSGSRNFMDALLAFWPGLQVLKGDLKAAIELHELLYQITQRHNFLPEAFTTDFHVHWAQHPLRPEFVESTYFLHKATGDPYYLDVGKSIVDNLEKHARVPCGFAAIRDVRQVSHEDQMDSYVLAETFKYLYLLYTDSADLVLDIDDYVFTTEAHLLPLSLSMQNYSFNFSKVVVHPSKMSDVLESSSDTFCPNFNRSPLFPDGFSYASKIRLGLKDFVEKKCPKPKIRVPRLKAADFIAGSVAQQELLADMGIKLVTMNDGRMQLIHSQSQAADAERAEEGLLFMREMLELAQQQQVGGAADVKTEPRIVQIVSEPFDGRSVYQAGAAQFGYDLGKEPPLEAPVVLSEPSNGCAEVRNAVAGSIAIVERGGCMFIEKARHVENAGGLGVIVIDNNAGTTSASSPFFHMSGDAVTEVSIPVVFLFHVEGQAVVDALRTHGKVVVRLANKPTVRHKTAADEQHSFASRRALVRTNMARLDNTLIVNIELSDVVVVISMPYRHLQVDQSGLEENVILERDERRAKHVLSISITRLTPGDGDEDATHDLPPVNAVYPHVEEVLYRKSPLKGLAKHGEYMRTLKELLDVAWEVKPSSVFDAASEETLLEMMDQLSTAMASNGSSESTGSAAADDGKRRLPAVETAAADGATSMTYSYGRSEPGQQDTIPSGFTAGTPSSAGVEDGSRACRPGAAGCEGVVGSGESSRRQPDDGSVPGLLGHVVRAVFTKLAIAPLEDDDGGVGSGSGGGAAKAGEGLPTSLPVLVKASAIGHENKALEVREQTTAADGVEPSDDHEHVSVGDFRQQLVPQLEEHKQSCCSHDGSCKSAAAAKAGSASSDHCCDSTCLDTVADGNDELIRTHMPVEAVAVQEKLADQGIVAADAAAAAVETVDHSLREIYGLLGNGIVVERLVRSHMVPEHHPASDRGGPDGSSTYGTAAASAAHATSAGVSSSRDEL